MPTAIITLLTDFGTRDPYVGIMKGVLLSGAPEATIVDLTHAIPPQDVVAGALALRSAVAFFPAGSIHVAVIDPGVGSARTPIVVEAAGATFVGPDNGLLAPAARALGVRGIYAIDNPTLRRESVSSTFHGRDIFAPTAAWLARGGAAAAAGAPCTSMVEVEVPAPEITQNGARGVVVYVDAFGNLITNIPATALTGDPARTAVVHIGAFDAGPLRPAYAAAERGSLVAVIGSWDSLEIAVRDGSAAAYTGLGVGAAVRVDLA